MCGTKMENYYEVEGKLNKFNSTDERQISWKATMDPY